MEVKQLSFQVNWVNTQAFLINWVLCETCLRLVEILGLPAKMKVTF